MRTAQTWLRVGQEASVARLEKFNLAKAPRGVRTLLWVLGLTVCAALATPAQAQTFGCTPAMANDIVCENSKTGAPPSEWGTDGFDSSAIEGFATDISFNRGQTAFFKINTNAAWYELDIYRLGYYGGNGARLVATVYPSVALPQIQPSCFTESASRLYDCGNWSVSASWDIPANATSGIYFAKLIRTDTGESNHLMFLVRDDAGHSDVLYQTSDSTWQAYNEYGGFSLYRQAGYSDLANRAYKVSYNRPFNASRFFDDEYPLVQWLEANGYSVSYFTDLDSDRNGSLIPNHKVFVSSGHDEYWSGGQRSNVEAARDAGVHLAFFSGNEIFWKTRWETSIDGSGTPYRTLVCYKETHAGARIDPLAPAVWTGTWRDRRFSPPGDGGRPENSLSGTIFMVNGPGPDNNGLSIKVPEADGKMRFWRNTSVSTLSAGQTAVLPGGTLGYEWDVSDDNGFRPAGLFFLSTTTQDLTTNYLLDDGSVYGAGTATHHLTMYRAPSGALVFGAGTVQWSWGLDNFHSNPFSFPTPEVSTDMQQATVNLFADMDAQPATLQSGLVPAAKSTDTLPPASAILSPAPGGTLIVGAPFLVTGTASDSGGGLVAGVEISTDNGQTWHPANGRGNWTYSFTPTQMGPVTFKTRAVDDSGYLETPGAGVSAIAMGTWGISGTINPPAAGSGATVTLAGAWSATTTADSSGHYSFTSLVDGNYDITPTKAGFDFSPVSAAVTIADAGVSGVNFIASQPAGATYSISGSVAPASYGQNVIITLTGTAIGSTVTDASGNFTIAGLPNGSYTISPSKPGFLFNPAHAPVTLAGASVSGIALTASSTQQTLFTTQVPAGSYSDVVEHEIGTKFQSDIAGQITAVRFWKGIYETGTHIGKIWSETGVLLASVTFSNESASGWQQQPLAAPLSIAADTTYVVSVNTVHTFYVATDNELGTQVVNGDLRSVVGQNGVYGPPGVFPTSSYQNSNYYRDIAFVSSATSTLASLSLSQGNVVGGSALSGTVTLSGPAPAGGAVVTLVSDNPAVQVPASVTVNAGATSAAFTVSSSAVAGATPVIISAIYNNLRTATLVVVPPALTTLTLNPPSLTGGSSSTGTVILNGPAPAGGATITLSADNPAAGVAASVTVPEGATGATFPVTTSAVNTSTPVTITGGYNGTQNATLTILPPVLSAVSLDPASVTGGNASTGSVTLNGPAPADGALVTLSSDNAAAIVPANVIVEPGATEASFSITADGVGVVTAAVITGNFGGTQSATLTINTASLSTLVLNQATVVGGTISTARVTLNGAAPAGGTIVVLSSDNPAAATVPDSVTVPQGQIAAFFPVTTIASAVAASANISASYLGTQSATLTIDATTLSAVTLNPASVAGGNSSTGTVTLNGPAPAGGAIVMLSSDNPSVSGIEGVYSSAGLPVGGSTDWSSLGAEYSSIPSGIVATVAGQPGLNLTLTTATGLPMQRLSNCATGGDCGWWGNFAPGAPLLSMSGTYDASTEWWTPNGPLAITFSSPQRGVGLQIMADESGPFTPTLCAYNSSNTLLGCVPFRGNASGAADNSAVFIGLYDDVQEIAKVTIDNNGPLYPHDFAVGSILVTGARRQMVPASVTVPEGAASADFVVSTSSVSAVTTAIISATYGVTHSANLAINPSVLDGITLTQPSVTGGTASIATVTLTGAAPSGGAVVMLAANDPVAPGLQKVTDAAGMPHDGSVNWSSIGSNFAPVDSGTSVPVAGLPGLQMTLSASANQPLQILTNCPGIVNCGWGGNFAPGAQLLWVGGNYDENGETWTGHGPMTLTLTSPQHGIGFRIMADELGPFTATLCAYGAADQLLGCMPFTGNGDVFPNNSAAFFGFYSDAGEIAKVTLDAGGALYPHDFAIEQVFVSSTRRMVPPSVKVEAGASTATFRVNTNTVETQTPVTITGDYQTTRTADLAILP